MSIDLGAALRRRKPEKRLQRLRPRPVEDLPGVAQAPWLPLPLVLDTNVYIHNARGTLPAPVEALLGRAQLFHCSVCLAELATGIANADPRHSAWGRVRDHYESVIGSIPEARVLTPDRAIWLEAGLLSGILSRTQGYQPYQRKEALNDALIFLTASRAGLPVLTSNRDDFDLLQQLAPEGRFFHYGRPMG